MYGHSVCLLYWGLIYFVGEGGLTAISLSDSGTNKENTMSKENIQLVVALIISIGFLFYVTTTSSDIKFPPPIELMGAG